MRCSELLITPVFRFVFLDWHSYCRRVCEKFWFLLFLQSLSHSLFLRIQHSFGGSIEFETREKSSMNVHSSEPNNERLTLSCCGSHFKTVMLSRDVVPWLNEIIRCFSVFSFPTASHRIFATLLGWRHNMNVFPFNDDLYSLAFTLSLPILVKNIIVRCITCSILLKILGIVSNHRRYLHLSASHTKFHFTTFGSIR